MTSDGSFFATLSTLRPHRQSRVITVFARISIFGTLTFYYSRLGFRQLHAHSPTLLGHSSIRSYETVVKRWPVILTGVIDSVYSENHALTDCPDKADKLEEGKALIATISRLKYGMARDRALEQVISPPPRTSVHIKSRSAGLSQMTAKPS